MTTLYLDTFSGASGNMLLGCLLDLGVSQEQLRQAIEEMQLDGCSLAVASVQRTGITAVHATVALPGETAAHGDHDHHHEENNEHSHHHHHEEPAVGELDKLPHLANEADHHHHVGLKELIARVETMPFSTKVRAISCAVLRRLGAAEAKVHGKPIDEVHFHEVGSLDTLADIVGTVLCLEWLGVSRIVASPVTTGFGTVQCAHGVMPVPAPATQELLSGIPHRRGDTAGELLTPTGAALLAELVNEWGDIPVGFQQTRVGYGAGSKILAAPNVLRGILGEEQTVARDANIYVLETNIDDLNPQFYAYAMNKLFAAGALDVWLTPIQMKKGRPAHLVSVLLHHDLLETAAEILFSETSTIGVRYYPVNRIMADRKLITVDLPWGSVHAKVAYRNGKVVQVAPEYEDCQQLAAMHDVTLKQVWQKAMQLALDKVEHE